MLALALGGSVVLVPYAIKFAGVSDDGSLSSNSLEQYIVKRQNYNMDGGSSVDISSMSLPFQMFTYAFRPLPTEARSFTSLFASLDNFILFVIVIIVGKRIFKRPPNQYGDNLSFLWVFTLTTWIVLSVTTSNLGIAMRQKWMFIPILVYLLLSAVIKSNQKLKY